MGFLSPPQGAQGESQVVPDAGVGGVERRGGLQFTRRLGHAPDARQGEAQVASCLPPLRAPGRGVLKVRQRLCRPRQGVQGAAEVVACRTQGRVEQQRLTVTVGGSRTVAAAVEEIAALQQLACRFSSGHGCRPPILRG